MSLAHSYAELANIFIIIMTFDIGDNGIFVQNSSIAKKPFMFSLEMI